MKYVSDSHLPTRERVNWGYSQWVIDDWNKYCDESGLTKWADGVRENMRLARQIANDTSLTPQQRIRKIRKLSNHSGL